MTDTHLVSIMPTTDTTLPIYSNSRLVDVNVCPTWGVVHSQRQYPSHARAMALEAGEAMHQVFAAVRIWQLEHKQKKPKHALAAAKRIFGLDRWRECAAGAGMALDKGASRDSLVELAFNVLHTSGFYDDPADTMRTITNMEVATIRYIDERLPLMETWPIWCEGGPTKRVGIECTFDVTLTFADGRLVRYIGTMDGLVLAAHHNNRPTLDENKTASRLDEGWRTSFEMAHQVTGYCAAATAVFGFPVWNARILGIKIKQGSYGDNSRIFEVSRTAESIMHWAAWVRHTVDMRERFQDDFENAPRYTHSCNRYFRACALIPFCADSAEGRAEQWDEMVPVEPSPSERAVMEQF